MFSVTLKMQNVKYLKTNLKKFFLYLILMPRVPVIVNYIYRYVTFTSLLFSSVPLWNLLMALYMCMGKDIN